MKNNKNGFTLIELLIVIGIIAILAVSIIIAINPGQQFAQARDATRQGHINSLNNAILSYMVSNYGDLSGLGIPPTATEICNNTSTCEGLVNLEPLLTGGHLSAIPIDPSGGIDDNGSGYRIFTYGSDPAIHASKAETRAIQAGNWTFTDPRDGNTYKTVLIGDQLWMAENLVYLPSVVGPGTGSETTPYYYVYNYYGTDVSAAKATANYATYGVLYNWPAATTACPSGWHLPSDAELNTLETYVVSYINSPNPQYPCSTSEGGWRRCADNDGTDAGGTYGAGKSLKKVGIGSGVGAGDDLVGFSALLAGSRYTDGSFYYLGSDTHFWSSSASSSSNAWRRRLLTSYSTVARDSSTKANGFSVRCLRD